MESLYFLIDIIFEIINGQSANILEPQMCILPLIPLIAMGVSALSAGGSAIAGAKGNKKNQKILNQLNSENENDYLREYYRGAVDNDGAKAYLKRLDSRMRDRDKAIENGAVATGATQENILAKKKANNEVMSDAVAGLVEREDNRKDQVRQNYFNRKQSIRSGQMHQNSAVANNWANLGSNISSAAGSLASAYLTGDDFSIKRSGSYQPNIAGDQYNRLTQYNLPK